MIHSLRTRVSSKNIIDGRPINRSDVWQRTLSSCMDFDFANLREHTEKNIISPVIKHFYFSVSLFASKVFLVKKINKNRFHPQIFLKAEDIK